MFITADGPWPASISTLVVGGGGEAGLEGEGGRKMSLFNRDNQCLGKWRGKKGNGLLRIMSGLNRIPKDLAAGGKKNLTMNVGEQHVSSCSKQNTHVL